MIAFLSLSFHVLVSPLKTRMQLEAEIVLLRHQLNVLHRRVPSKPKLAVADRLLFVWLYRLFPSALNAATIVQPATIIRWHRAAFRLYAAPKTCWAPSCAATCCWPMRPTPPTSCMKRSPRFDKPLYRRRNLVERFF